MMAYRLRVVVMMYPGLGMHQVGKKEAPTVSTEFVRSEKVVGT